MLTFIDTQSGKLIVSAGNLTTAFTGQITPAIQSFALEQYRYENRAGESLAYGTDRCAIANELVLSFTKVQGSANEIQVQITESDTEDFALANVIGIRGQAWLTIKSDAYADSIQYRVEPIAIRGKYVKIAARYSGGAAASAAISLYSKFFHNEQMHPGSTALVGASGLAADVRSIDRVADEGLAYSAAIAVSGGSWSGGTVTMTCTSHAWIAGDIITVSGCGNANYNGVHTLTSVASNTISATLADPGAFTTNGSAIQAQSTTRLVDERKSWTANQWSTLGGYIEITSGTGARQYKAITSNGTHWLAFAAMTTAPVTSDSSYSVIESGVKALVCDTELNLSVGSITVSSIDAFKYIAAPPDLAGGESAQGRCDIKGNLQVVGPEAHGAAVARAPVLAGGYAAAAVQTAVDAGDVCRIWTTLNGAQVVAGRNQDAVADVSTALEVGTDNAASIATPTPLRVGGVARTSGADYTTGDTCVFSFDLKGGVRVAGGTPTGEAFIGNPLNCGGKASDVILGAVDAGDAQPMWLSLNGALVGAGLYQHATPANAIAKALPVVVDDAIMLTGAVALPVAGQYNASALTYTDKDATVLQTTVSGVLKTTTGISSGSILHGQKTIATPGTEEAITGSNVLTNGQKVVVKALITNAADVYVGGNPVTSATGFVLSPGDSCDLAVNNTNLIYLDVATAVDGVSWIVEAG